MECVWLLALPEKVSLWPWLMLWAWLGRLVSARVTLLDPPAAPRAVVPDPPRVLLLMSGRFRVVPDFHEAGAADHKDGYRVSAELTAEPSSISQPVSAVVLMVAATVPAGTRRS
jgi:hypothetical protein